MNNIFSPFAQIETNERMNPTKINMCVSGINKTLHGGKKFLIVYIVQVYRGLRSISV